MSVLLAIISHPKDNQLLKRHWKFFKMTGWPILGCGTEDGQCEWPDAVTRLDTGKLGLKDTPAGTAIYGLIEQELEIWKYCWDHKYDSVCVVEPDNLFVRMPPPPPETNYRVTLLPNHAPHGLFSTDQYFSTPRWAPREIAGLLYIYGRAMFRRGETEHWMSDRFPAAICYQHGIPFEGQKGWSPSVNMQSDKDWIREARTAIKRGAYALHAVKHQWQLDAIKDLLPCL